MERVKGGESGEDEQGGKDVGDEDCKESVTGVDDDGDGLARGVLFPVGSVDVDEFVLLFGEATVGVCFAGGAGTEYLHFDLNFAVGRVDDGTVVGGYCLHDLGAFLQFLTHLPSVFILWISPR